MRGLCYTIVMCGWVLPMGCSDPLAKQTTQALRDQVIESMRRQTQSASPGVVRQTTAEDIEPYITDPDRLRKIDEESGPEAIRNVQVKIEELTLDGKPSRVVQMSLEQAVRSAVKNNVDLKVARLAPAIREADVAAAEAAFDAVFFAEGSYGNTDRPQPVRLIQSGDPDGPLGPLRPTLSPIGVGNTVAQTANLTTGIRQPLQSGAQVVLSTGFDYSNNKTTGIFLSPDPAWNTNVTLGIQQPLLRNFGTDVNRAQIEINENAHRREVLALHGQLIETIAQVESVYWNLVFARRVLAIRQRGLQLAIETRDIIKERRVLDALSEQYAQAELSVERNRGALIAQRASMLELSDQLKRLLNDPNLPLSDETLIVPVDEPIEVPVEYNLLDAMVIAMRKHPDARAALLDIDDSSIRLKVADNLLLPVLNLNAQVAYLGLNEEDERLGGSYANLAEGDFIEYLLGVQFEAPIGNREARANYQRSRLEKQALLMRYQSVGQDILLGVKTALRNQASAFQQILTARHARRAASEYLRTLDLRVRQLEGLTPGQVDRRLSAQDQLIAAQAEEYRNILSYNVAIMQVKQAQGTLLEHNNIEMRWPENLFAD